MGLEGAHLAQHEAVFRVPGVVAMCPRHLGHASERSVHVVERPGHDHVVVDAHVGTHYEHGVADALEGGRYLPDCQQMLLLVSVGSHRQHQLTFDWT